MRKTGKGVFPIQLIKHAVQKGFIQAREPIRSDQYQPSSIDLRLGEKAYRIRSSFLPQKRKVEEILGELEMYEIDLKKGAILEKGNVYLIPLLEELNLPEDVYARANPKSSTGRLDIFTRVITDNSHRFEDVAAGYRGKLYLEVVPRSFTIKLKTGLCLNQLRLFRGDSSLSDIEIAKIHEESPLLYCYSRESIVPVLNDGLFVSIEVVKEGNGGVIGYMAKKNSTVIDLSNVGGYRVRDFWDPITSPEENFLILEPEEFYIFASKERVRVPVDCAAEMAEYDAGSGELRTHYAGFFDSGFGGGSVEGTKAVLEVRPHDVPFRIEDGQIFFKLRYERMLETPNVAYGEKLGSNYFNQGLRLSKHFVMESE